MWIYILVFIMSCLLIFWAENTKNRFNYFLYFLSIFIPSVLAGGRADFIGTDVRLYVEPLHLYANNTPNLLEYLNSHIYLFQAGDFSKFEKGYVLLTYICSRINQSLFFNLFIIEFLMLALVLGSLIRLKKYYNNSISITLGMLLYYFIFYNLSLNMVRQSIAMAILFFGFSYLVENKGIIYILLTFLATLFHRTAIIGLVILLIYYFLFGVRKNKRNKLNVNLISKTILIITVASIIIFSWSILIKLANLSGLSKIIGGYLVAPNYGISFYELILRIPFIIILWLSWKYMKENKLRYLYLNFIALDILLLFLGKTSTYTSRISYYLAIFYVISSIDEITYIPREWKILTILLLGIYIILYWYYIIVLLGFNETVPYIWYTGINIL